MNRNGEKIASFSFKNRKKITKTVELDDSLEEERLFFDGDSYFSRLIEDIATANQRVVVESYIFALDGYGRKLLSAMLGAIKRGVKVYLMVDGVGSVEYIAKLTKIAHKAGIHFQIFHPLPWQLQRVAWYNFIPVFLIKLIAGVAELNCRNHRKYCLIDDRILYTGSFNVLGGCENKPPTATVLEDFKMDGGVRTTDWCEVGVRVAMQKTGGTSSLSLIAKSFAAIWARRKWRKNWRAVAGYVKSDPWLRLNHLWFQRFSLRRAMLRRLQAAQRRVWITNAYFVPDSRFMRVLLAVASRGVEVKILLPHHSDVAFMPLAARTFYQRMLAHGVQIYEYLPAILHAKTLIIDDWMIVGSSNLNHRSLLHDLELDVKLRTMREKGRLVEDFQCKLAQSRRVYLADLLAVSWWKKAAGYLLLWLRYWL